MQRIEVGVGPVTEDELVAVARGGAGVSIAPVALEALEASRAFVEALAQDAEPHYGISTGFGRLAPRATPARLRRPGRARGRARDDAAAPVDPDHGTHRRAAVHRAGPGRSARSQRDPGG